MSKPPTSAHDAWLKFTLGLDTAKPGDGRGSPLPPAPPDKQSQEFRTQFEAAIAPVDAAITYLSSHAPDPTKAAVMKKREVLVTVYQTALAKVDPADEAKGKPVLAKALAGAQSVATEAGAAQQTAEKLVNEWTAREPKLEDAAGDIEEMEDWGYNKVAPLRTQLDALEGPVEARTYDVANAAADKLLAAMAPVLNDFSKQKAAKEKYEPARDAISDRVTKATGNDRAKLQPQCDPVRAAHDAMEASASKKDYVQALELLADLTTKLETFEKALEELDRKKAEYEKIKADVTAKLPQVQQSSFKKLEPAQQEIANGQTAADAAAQAEDYDQAVKIAGPLPGKCDEYAAELKKLEEARQDYDKAWADVKPRVPATTQEGGKRIAALQQTITTQSGQVTAAADAEDYGTALTQVNELGVNITDLETAVAARQRYTDQRKALEPKMPKSKTDAPALTELEARIDSERQQSEADAAEDEYEEACPQLLKLESTLAEYEAAVAKLDEQKKAYEQGLAALQEHLPASDEPAKGRLAELQTKIESLRTSAETAAKAQDYDAALKSLNEAEGLLPEYEDLENKRKQDPDRWAELQSRMPTATEPGASPDVIKLSQSITDMRTGMEGKVAKGDYAGALTDLDGLVKLLSDLDAAKAAAIRKREEFQKAYADTKQVVDQALATATDIAAVKAKQDALSANKAKVEDAVTRNDYDTATTLLKDVDTSLKDYQEELRKQPRNCAWINATATALMAGIMQYYMGAQSKINNAAQSYDQALAEHKQAVAAVDAKRQLLENLLVGIFFAGLGGAVGGAVAGGMKSTIEDAFGKAAASGAILDATKDIAKFTTRSLQLLGGSPGNPAAGVGSVGGNGVELARKVGTAVNMQGESLLTEVRKLANMVRDNPDACDSKEGIRVEGDPAAVIEFDPFLKVLGTIASADKRSFAQLLWGAWINEHAYTIREITTKAGQFKVIDDNVENILAWWGKLVPNIEQQAGKDFGLRARLDEARKAVQQQIDNEKKKNYGY